MGHRIRIHCCFIATSCAAMAASFDGLNFDLAVSLGNLNSAAVTEASGITVSGFNPGVFWTHNDGAKDSIYAFRMDGTLMATFRLRQTTRDVEEIASGPGPKANTTYLYVGDIGSNTATRDRVRIFRVEEPVIDPTWANQPVSRDFASVVGCDFIYPDGFYNAEGMLLDGPGGMIYVVTKQFGAARFYRAPLNAIVDGGSANLELAGELPFDVVSGAAMSKDGTLIAVRRESFALAWQRQSGESVIDALQRPGTPIPLVGTPVEPNGEAISFLPDSSGYVTLSEGVNQPVYFFKRKLCDQEPRFLDAPFKDADGVHLIFSACAGTNLAVDRASIIPEWHEIGRVNMTSGSGEFLDAEDLGTRFYRLRIVE